MVECVTIALLSNACGGLNMRRGLEKIETLASQLGIVHEIVQDAVQIGPALQRLSVKSPDILAVNGGDGTVDMLVRHMREKCIFETEPLLALLPGGTTNMIHRDCGFSCRTESALVKIFSGKNLNVVERSPLQIKNEEGEILYGFFLATGAIPRAVEKARQTRFKGKCGEVLALASVLWRLKMKKDLSHDVVLSPEFMSVIENDNMQDRDRIFFAVTALEHLIFGISVKHDPNSVAVLEMDSSRKMQRRAAQRIIFMPQSPWVIDGEEQKPGRFEITPALPLRFLTDRNHA